MRFSISTYIPRTSPVHACDARVKIPLLAVFTVAVFFIDTWIGMIVAAVALVAVIAASRIGVRPLAGSAVVVFALMALTIVFNAFAVDVSQADPSSPALGPGALSFSAAGEPVTLLGTFGLSLSGLSRGCFYAVRILLLVEASLAVCYTTTSTDATNALGGFLRPLRPLRVPVDDIATIVSIALRFIPVMVGEFGRIRDAQWARCAPFDEGPLGVRLRAWASVFVPLFAGLFRRADALAAAMDARCYGMPGARRTSLSRRSFSPRSAAVLAVGLAACVVLAALL